MMTDQKMLTPDEAAAYLDVTVKTLAKWRNSKWQIIPYTKIKEKILYNVDDLDKYIDACNRRN